jgi:mannan polymerase II complex MNN10 subunit
MINAYPEGACGDDKGLPKGGCPRPLKKVKFSDPALALPDHQDTSTLEAMKECGVHGVHYQARERDFLVNMAGCEFGRECAEEMEDFEELSLKLNRGRIRKVWDWIVGKERRDREEMIKEKERRRKAKEEWARLEEERNRRLADGR